jgi:prophage regulatory protein
MEPTPLLRLPAVIRVTGLSRSTIYKLISEGSFPSALKLTERSVAWSSGDIQQWIDSRTPTRPVRTKEEQAEPIHVTRQTRRPRLRRR